LFELFFIVLLLLFFDFCHQYFIGFVNKKSFFFTSEYDKCQQLLGKDISQKLKQDFENIP